MPHNAISTLFYLTGCETETTTRPKLLPLTRRMRSRQRLQNNSPDPQPQPLRVRGESIALPGSLRLRAGFYWPLWSAGVASRPIPRSDPPRSPKCLRQAATAVKHVKRRMESNTRQHEVRKQARQKGDKNIFLLHRQYSCCP